VGGPGLEVSSQPLPAWGPADLAAALGGREVAILEGLSYGEDRSTLVAWDPGPPFHSVARGLLEAGRERVAPGVPPLLGAAIGRIAWDGSARFHVPGAAALFHPGAGTLWVRGELPAVKPGRDGGAADGGSDRVAGAGHAAARPLWGRTAFCGAVRMAQARMAAGQLEKAILSVPFDCPCTLHPIAVFQRLRAGAHAGLAFLLPDGAGAHLIGLSPEPLVRLSGSRAELHLLAGTRPAGADLEAELVASPKDRTEHLLAVEQARRDLLAVCAPGTVRVDSCLDLEEHPGLIHLASRLSGLLREGAHPRDLVNACFPAGTVGGVPRDEAVALIDRLEPLPRNWYAGAVGALLPNGDVQLWLTIRSLRLADGVARLRTGAGVVRESVPEAEWQECLTKAGRTAAAIGAEVAEDGFA
jgi:hypothetical protein